MCSNPILARLYSVALSGATCSRARQNAVLLLRDYAASLGLELSDSDKIEQSTISARLSIPDAAFAFLACRTNATFMRLLCALHSVDSAILSESDKMPANLLNPAAHAPEIPAYHVQRIPPDALTWQTKPASGVNPLLVAMLQQEADRIDAAKRAKARVAASAKVTKQSHAVALAKLRGPANLRGPAKLRGPAQVTRSVPGPSIPIRSVPGPSTPIRSVPGPSISKLSALVERFNSR